VGEDKEEIFWDINKYVEDVRQYWKNKEEIFVGIYVFLYLKEKYENKFIVFSKEQRYGMSLGGRGIILTGVISS
jgi:hypothetical protein